MAAAAASQRSSHSAGRVGSGTGRPSPCPPANHDRSLPVFSDIFSVAPHAGPTPSVRPSRAAREGQPWDAPGARLASSSPLLPDLQRVALAAPAPPQDTVIVTEPQLLPLRHNGRNWAVPPAECDSRR